MTVYYCRDCLKEELSAKSEHQHFKCKECFTEFISCYRCEKDGGQVEIDYLENDKGSFCAKCEKHFCTMHGQNTGGFKEMSGLEEVWFCEDCF